MCCSLALLALLLSSICTVMVATFMNGRLACTLSLLLPATAVSARAGLLDFLTGHRDIEVITVTDMTPEGRRQRAPTAGEPVYYVAASLGFKDLSSVGGDKPPPEEDVLRTITTALAKRGFLPASKATPPPTLALAFTWGTLNADMDYGFNPDEPPRQRNRQQILKFLGGYKVGFSDRDFDAAMPPVAGLNFFDFDQRDFYDLAQEDFYMAIVSAYDLKAFKAKQRKLLWMTRISCPSRGFAMHDVLPTMLAIAGPNLGRETSRPVWVNASDKYKPNVELGETKLLDFFSPGSRSTVNDLVGESKKPATAPQPKPPATSAESKR